MVSGGFALLATTGALAAGLGGPAAGAAVGAVTVGGVVTGLVPLVAAGALGILGRKSLLLYFCVKPTNYNICLLSGVSSLMCVGPAYCTTPGGQCCLLALDPDLGTLVCPLSCSA